MKKKKRMILLDIIAACAVISACFAGVQLYHAHQNYKEIDETYERIREESKPQKENKTSEESQPGRDWQALLNINEDTAGWISLADSTVDYPVVYGKDNSWYLYHMFDGNTGPGGCIFVDWRNARGFTDRNTVIYGHHMYNDSMFHDIEKYSDPSYYESHKMIMLETPEGNYQLEPAAGSVEKGTDPYIRVEFSSEEDYQQYIRHFMENSTFSSGITIGKGDRTVLLSTCSDKIDDGRYALLCRLVKIS